MPGSTSRAASVAIAAFSTCWSADLATNPGSYEARPEISGRAAVDLLEQAVVVEDLEVAADRHVRHAELAREVGDPDGAALADPVEDECLALAGQHRLRSQFRRAGTAASVRPRDRRRRARRMCILTAEPRRSQRIRTNKPVRIRASLLTLCRSLATIQPWPRLRRYVAGRSIQEELVWTTSTASGPSRAARC